MVMRTWGEEPLYSTNGNVNFGDYYVYLWRFLKKLKRKQTYGLHLIYYYSTYT